MPLQVRGRQMKKELPINGEPFIRALPQYAFLDAILNHHDTNADEICRMEIEGFQAGEWHFTQHCADIRTEEETIHVYREGLGIESTAVWYRNMQKSSEIVFCLAYMQYTNRWDRVTFFINGHTDFLQDDEQPADYKLIVHCCGDLRVDVGKSTVFYKSNRESKEIPKWYRITAEDGRIALYVSWEGQKWELLHEEIVEVSLTKKKQGFCVCLCENQYFKWICNNFQLIRYERDAGEIINYTGLLRRDWKNCAVHPLVRFSYDKGEMIKQRGLWEYVTESIRYNRYLEIWLNEYFIEGTAAYHSYFYNHESLIYGYEETGKKIKMMSLYNGKPVLIEAPIDMIETAWYHACENNAEIKGFELAPDEGGYELDLVHIYGQVQDYLSGRDCSEDYQYLAQKEKGIFGMPIYGEILNHEQDRKKFLEDVRAAYSIKEHKECMRFRFRYLHEGGILPDEEYQMLMEQADEAVATADILLHMVLKNKMVNRTEIKEKIWEYLERLKKCDRKCCRFFLHILEVM